MQYKFSIYREINYTIKYIQNIQEYYLLLCLLPLGKGGEGQDKKAPSYIIVSFT